MWVMVGIFAAEMWAFAMIWYMNSNQTCFGIPYEDGSFEVQCWYIP